MAFWYDLGIRMYGAGIKAAAFFYPKAKHWVEGRKNWLKDLEEALGELPSPSAGRVWIHCASLGEFEQGRPLIESIKEANPDIQVILSFFSPSGYLLRKDYSLADHVCYLPLDTYSNACQFLDRVDPDLVLFVKYEFWLNFLAESEKRNIPVILVSGIFREGQVFFRKFGGNFRQVLAGFDQLFLQTESSARLLDRIGISNYKVVGDTRVDRVAANAAKAPEIELAKTFTGDREVLIAGSTWAPDEKLLATLRGSALARKRKIILAPHEINEADLSRVEGFFPNHSIRYSSADMDDARKARVMLIDNMGMLAGLYRYGHVAFIGGGFGSGLHNILEPAAFGLPVLFGPRYGKFEEASRLIEAGGAFPVRNEIELKAALNQLELPEFYQKASAAAQDYIAQNRGATQAIIDYIRQEGFLVLS